jgi:hypothetical protein
MATEASTSATNGDTLPDTSGISPAALLQQKHAKDEAHQATVEDVIDEDDIQHPPPSASVAKEAQPTNGDKQPISDKAMGKQKAREPTAGKPALDTQSEEAFPALGGAKPRQPPLWGARKATGPGKPSTNGVSNGLASVPPLSSTSSSRASTPVSGIHTPSTTTASSTPQPRGPAVKSIPGMGGSHTERISFTASQLLNPSQLKKSYGEIVRDINKRSKANLQVLRGRGGELIFEGRGPVEAVRQSLKEIAQQVGSKVRILLKLDD